jgi:phasin family protein
MNIKTKPAAEVAAAVEEASAAAAKGFEASGTAMKDGFGRTAAGVTEAQAKMKEGMEKAMKTAEEMVAFGQGNVEAVLKSGQIWAAGVQDISKQVAVSAQASIDETLSTFRAMTSVKSLKDAMDLQANLARSTLEKALAESGKLTDASFKLTEQALAPLTARVTLAMEKFAKAA